MTMTGAHYIVGTILNEPALQAEVCKGGLGNDIFRELEKEGKVPLKVLIKWYYAMKEAFKIVTELLNEFG